MASESFVELHASSGTWRAQGIEDLDPLFTIDGSAPGRLPGWRPVRVPVGVGPHTVELWVPHWDYRKAYGKRSIDVDVGTDGVGVGWFLESSGMHEASIVSGPPCATAPPVVALQDAIHAAIVDQPHLGPPTDGRTLYRILDVGADPARWPYKPKGGLDAPPWWFEGWWPDPTHRFKWRYWTGIVWTKWVSDGRVTLQNPTG